MCHNKWSENAATPHTAPTHNGHYQLDRRNRYMFAHHSDKYSSNIKEKNFLKPLLSNQSGVKFEGIEEKCKSPYNSSLKTKTRYIQNKLSSSLRRYKTQTSTDSFKANRDKSFLILIGIVVIFFICNLPRLFVKVFIISNGGEGQDHFEKCLKNNRLPVPGWIIIMGTYH